MDALCNICFIINETIVNIEHEEYVSKIIDVFQRTCSYLEKKKKKKNTRFPSLLFLCTEKFTDTNLFTFSHDRAALLPNRKNVQLSCTKI